MSIAVCTCRCGSTEQLARSFLKKAGCPDWLGIPIFQGKEASLQLLERVPQFPEVEMLRNYLREASKWVVILGWNENGCRWADIVHTPTKSQEDAKVIAEVFSLSSSLHV